MNFLRTIFQKNYICRNSIMGISSYKSLLFFLPNNWVVEINFYDANRKLRKKCYYYSDEITAKNAEVIFRNYCVKCNNPSHNPSILCKH